jgi:hypothetical protein
MNNINGKWLLTLVALFCLSPLSLAGGPRDDDHGGGGNCGNHGRGNNKDCRQVPEGGSSLIYLLGAGITCAGAILIHSREKKQNSA